MSESVDHIVKSKLCLQCGTCEGICPEGAIDIKEYGNSGLLFPVINSRCIKCGLCYQVCPVDELSLQTKPLEHYKSIGIYSTSMGGDKEQVSSSGGAVTTILKYLFKSKIINKAVVAMMDKSNYLEPQGVVIDSTDALDKIRGSIYQPVNLNKALKHLCNNDRVAIVGLACHIKGFTKYVVQKKSLNLKYIFKIGLLCNIGRSRNATRLLIDKYTCKRDGDVQELHYRKGKYPGNLIIVTKNRTIEVPFKEYITRTVYFFPPRGCLFCDDLFNEQSDISVGDPWGILEEKKALIIDKSKKSKAVLSDMITIGQLKLEMDLNKDDAIATQNYKHKNNRAIRSILYSKVGISIPKKIRNELNAHKKIEVSLYDAFLAFALLSNSMLFNSKLYFLAKYIPYKVLNKLSIFVKKSYG